MVCTHAFASHLLLRLGFYSLTSFESPKVACHRKHPLMQMDIDYQSCVTVRLACIQLAFCNYSHATLLPTLLHYLQMQSPTQHMATGLTCFMFALVLRTGDCTNRL